MHEWSATDDVDAFEKIPNGTRYTKTSNKGRRKTARRQQLFERQQNKPRKHCGNFRLRLWESWPFCHWCKKKLGFEESTIEHLVRQADGGMTTLANCRVACAPRNHHRGEESRPAKVALIARRVVNARGS